MCVVIYHISMIPVLAVGFDDLKKRYTVQSERIQLHKNKLQEIKQGIQSYQKIHSVDFDSKIVEMQRKQKKINQQLIKVKSLVLRA